MTLTRKQLKEATRLRVLDAAGQLFKERGFSATTIRDIAQVSEVSVGSVIAVGDKDALLVQVFESQIEAEHIGRSNTLNRPNVAVGETCGDRLFALVQPFVSLFVSDFDMARKYASILVSGTHESLLFTKLADQLIEEFVSVILEDQCTSQANAPAKAQAMYAAYVGVLFTWSTSGSDNLIALSEKLRNTFAALCDCKE